ncbi:MAG: hypothetical protein R2911_10735 [Caldilineaceae bacterium]
MQARRWQRTPAALPGEECGLFCRPPRRAEAVATAHVASHAIEAAGMA